MIEKIYDSNGEYVVTFPIGGVKNLQVKIHQNLI
jgi:hypothetical protein